MWCVSWTKLWFTDRAILCCPISTPPQQIYSGFIWTSADNLEKTHVVLSLFSLHYTTQSNFPIHSPVKRELYLHQGPRSWCKKQEICGGWQWLLKCAFSRMWHDTRMLSTKHYFLRKFAHSFCLKLQIKI